MRISFKWVPTYGSAVTVKPAVQVTKFGDGYELRTPTGINSTPRQWKVIFANRTHAVANEIEAFFKARGAVQSFEWNPPNDTTAISRWVAREWSVEQTGPYTRTVTATFDEVFGA